MADLRNHAVECKEEADHLKNELSQAEKLKTRTEEERNHAIRQIQDLQEALDAIHKKSKDRSKKVCKCFIYHSMTIDDSQVDVESYQGDHIVLLCPTLSYFSALIKNVLLLGLK